MPDGTNVCLPGRGDHIVRLLGTVFGGATPEQEAEPDLVRRATAIQEAGGGRMLELLQAILLSPAEKET